jgi:hypothetical protein
LSTSSYAESSYVNNDELNTTQVYKFEVSKPVIVSGISYIPLSDIVENLRVKTLWNDNYKILQILINDEILFTSPGIKYGLVKKANENEFIKLKFDNPLLIKDNKTLIPLSWFFKNKSNTELVLINEIIPNLSLKEIESFDAYNELYPYKYEEDIRKLVNSFINKKLRVKGNWNIEEYKTKNKYYILNSEPFQPYKYFDSNYFLAYFKNKIYKFPIKILTSNNYDNFKNYNWPKNTWNRIKNEEISIGMNKDMVLMSWGYPDEINRDVGKWGVHEQWIYGDNYLYFENGILTSWQD